MEEDNNAKEKPITPNKESAFREYLINRIAAQNEILHYRYFIEKHSELNHSFVFYKNVTHDDLGQTLNVSFAKQVCKERGKAIEGMRFAGVYVDESYRHTGDFEYRPAFQRLVNDALVGCFDLIITDTMRRFSESLDETLRIVEELRLLKRPVTVYFEKDCTDSDMLHEILKELDEHSRNS